MSDVQRAYAEEFLSALYFIAAGLMFAVGIDWLGWVLALKAGWDTVCAIAVWYRMHRRELLEGGDA